MTFTRKETNFNPQAPCGARRAPLLKTVICNRISIHRPLAGPDTSQRPLRRVHNDFNPQAPCGARPTYCARIYLLFQFQSTGPLRGPTLTNCMSPSGSIFQSTGPLRGPTMNFHTGCTQICNFNPQAPCGARQDNQFFSPSNSNFNPQAPCGARRARRLGYTHDCDFNPQAPCGARPADPKMIVAIQGYFNPQAPCGARLQSPA